MKRSYKIIVAFIFIIATCQAQWTLKLSSNVYLRKWKLDTKANKEEKEIDGATVTLFQAGKQISQTTTSNGGEFTVLVPKDGEFYLTVSYPGCNTKRMAINTQNVPENMSKDNYKPSFEITGGFIMVRPYPGINYSELSQDLIRVEYLPNKKAFDDTEAGTEKGLGIVSKIYAAEDDLFNRFCSTNKAGDVALAKPDCPLAKSLYEKAISMIAGEQYPVDQLAKVGLCLKDKELAEAAAKAKAEEEAKKAAADAAAKTATQANKEKENKDAADKKAIADAIAKANADKAALVKEEEAKLAKASKEKAAKEDAEKEKLAKEKAEKEKKDKATEERLAKQKFYEEQRAKEKNGALIVKQKSPQEIEAEAKLAKQKEGQYKSQAEDKEAMAADAEKAKAKYEENQKAAKEREQKQKEGLAKSKAEDEAAMKDDEAKKAAKQKEREQKQKEGIAKSKAEDDAAIKADFEKKEKARAQREADEKEKKRLAYETKTKDGQGEMDKGNSDHSLPQVLGNTSEKYKAKIKVADDYFKMKRYDEAKIAYQGAMQYKANDPYATSKLADIEKLTAPK
ncbi:MAG: hypothetical protein H0U95_08670 [Bacteroidetes bacterium]|nr:hypothetical protein [Bacteroidota bacterium]